VIDFGTTHCPASRLPAYKRRFVPHKLRFHPARPASARDTRCPDRFWHSLPFRCGKPSIGAAWLHHRCISFMLQRGMISGQPIEERRMGRWPALAPKSFGVGNNAWPKWRSQIWFTATRAANGFSRLVNHRGTPIAGPLLVSGNRRWGVFVSGGELLLHERRRLSREPFQLRQSSFWRCRESSWPYPRPLWLSFSRPPRISSQASSVGLHFDTAREEQFSVPLRPSLASLASSAARAASFHSSLFFLPHLREIRRRRTACKVIRRASTTAKEIFAPRVAARQWPGWLVSGQISHASRPELRVQGSRRPPGEG